ncbi:MAG TPA: hypothetical protein VHV74_00200 [Pseudonocardiaceae bacterium]|nr:hypothetical protein [Pseudonocardiaceae bacterium]
MPQPPPAVIVRAWTRCSPPTWPISRHCWTRPAASRNRPSPTSHGVRSGPLGALTQNLVGLAVAREWLGERRGVSIAGEGVGALGDVAVFSGEPHSSVYKAISIPGDGRSWSPTRAP